VDLMGALRASLKGDGKRSAASPSKAARRSAKAKPAAKRNVG
jgi:hypothetical protein